MKIEGIFLIGVGIFFGLVGTAYWFSATNRVDDDARRDLPARPPSRQLLLLLVPPDAGIEVLLLGHAREQARNPPRGPSRRHHRRRAGTINSFPGSSIWPFVMAWAPSYCCSAWSSVSGSPFPGSP